MNKEITLESLQKEIKKLKSRNKKVEAEKAWEISNERKLLIIILTYTIIAIIMYLLKMSSPFINAIIPTSGYILSTISIGIFKNIYIEKYNKKGGK